MIFEWIPTISVGPFKFGDPIQHYIKQYGLIEEIAFEEQSHTSKEIIDFLKRTAICPIFYIPELGTSFSIDCDENNCIDDIRMDKYLFYHDQNIIAQSLESAVLILEQKWDDTDTEEINDEIQHIYYFNHLGLSLWTLNDITVTVFCSKAMY